MRRERAHSLCRGFTLLEYNQKHDCRFQSLVSISHCCRVATRWAAQFGAFLFFSCLLFVPTFSYLYSPIPVPPIPVDPRTRSFRIVGLDCRRSFPIPLTSALACLIIFKRVEPRIKGVSPFTGAWYCLPCPSNVTVRDHELSRWIALSYKSIFGEQIAWRCCITGRSNVSAILLCLQLCRLLQYTVHIICVQQCIKQALNCFPSGANPSASHLLEAVLLDCNVPFDHTGLLFFLSVIIRTLCCRLVFHNHRPHQISCVRLDGWRFVPWCFCVLLYVGFTSATSPAST